MTEIILADPAPFVLVFAGMFAICAGIVVASVAFVHWLDHRTAVDDYRTAYTYGRREPGHVIRAELLERMEQRRVDL